jgi:hypothetical protein
MRLFIFSVPKWELEINISGNMDRAQDKVVSL